jgi:hypothetical protein
MAMASSSWPPPGNWHIFAVWRSNSRRRDVNERVKVEELAPVSWTGRRKSQWGDELREGRKSPWAECPTERPILFSSTSHTWGRPAPCGIGRTDNARKLFLQPCAANPDVERGTWVGPTWVRQVGNMTLGDKNITILTKTLSKLWFLWFYPLFGPLMAWQVGPACGVRWAWIGWERFFKLLDLYSILG